MLAALNHMQIKLGTYLIELHDADVADTMHNTFETLSELICNACQSGVTSSIKSWTRDICHIFCGCFWVGWPDREGGHHHRCQVRSEWCWQECQAEPAVHRDC